MNKWQKVYLDAYGGKTPRSRAGKQKFDVLGYVKNEVTVHYPDLNLINGFTPAHSETFVVAENECNMPNGIISVQVLASNLVLWLGNGWKVTTK